jgi:quercetin dioxygenase-like cupin family protein
MFTRFLCGVVFAALSVTAASADELSTEKVTLVFDHALPNVPGKSMKGVLVEYPPGGSSPAHTHPDSAFIYATVLEGAIRSKVNDGLEKVYRAGESFAEGKRSPGVPSYAAGRMPWFRALGVGSKDGAGSP